MKDRNVLKGIFLMAIALVFGVGALRYNIGRLERAGPGFFPLMVSSILFSLGLFMVVRSRFMDKAAIVFNLKNLCIVLGSLAGFALLTHLFNMIAGILVLVFGSGFAATTYSVRRNLAISAVLIGIAFVFQKGLGLQLPLY
jgi:hypothetical protein